VENWTESAFYAASKNYVCPDDIEKRWVSGIGKKVAVVVAPLQLH